jgi:hypothetical protein
MDKATRNAIERATQQGRKLLDEDFSSQLEGTFDVLRSGVIASRGGAHLSAPQQSQRDKIVAAIEHKRAAGMPALEAVTDYVRDAAFTTLNRFIALKMLEARELVQECITKGEQSTGYREFCGMAPGIALLPDAAGYRLYIESLFDEFSTEIKVLFDRRDAASVLWPKRQTFDALLAILNAQELSAIWGEDETIGWVYQFFNSGEERKKMREESQAPRSSRELAVRNQFFTPRYVVQFLTDNTLGRLWLEMHGNKTRLTTICEYLVRSADEPAQGLPRKDPRDLRILDPACGSGHFLLYCFDLLLVIYEEAWAGADAPQSEATRRRLKEDYPDIRDLRADLPALILRHNLHGVDIDPRCAQIAQLALWMRAQRAFRDLGFARAERKAIRRSNIVIAEPMPGEKELLAEFLTELKGDRLEGLLRRALDIPADSKVKATKAMADSLSELVETVWDGMELAGEMGTLLKVERDLTRAIEKGRADWEDRLPLFRVADYGLGGMSNETLKGVVPSAPDDFWAKAEKLVFRALADYADSSSGTNVARRRLFTDDAAQGFALADLINNSFDVVLMNPPFGETTKRAFSTIKRNFPDSYYDLLACFIDRSMDICSGLVGCLVSEACLYGKYLAEWRSKQLIPSAECIVDLGDGVLDAMVKTAALVLRKSSPKQCITFIDATQSADKGHAISAGHAAPSDISRAEFYSVPNYAIVHSIPSSVRRAFTTFPKLRQVAKARSGLTTYDDDRFLRLLWEVSPTQLGVDNKWVPIFKGGGAHTFYNDVHLAVNFKDDGREVGAFNYALYGTDAQSRRASDYYFREGCCYGRAAGRWFSAKPLFPGMVFGDKGPAIIPEGSLSPYSLLAYLNSHPVRYLLHSQAQGGGIRTLHIETGLIDELPYPPFSSEDLVTFDTAARNAAEVRAGQHSISEVEPSFDVTVYLEKGTLIERRNRIVNLLEEGDRTILAGVNRISEVVDKYFEFDNDARRAYPSEEQHRAIDLYPLTSDNVCAINVLSCALGCAFGRFTQQKRPAAGHFPLMGVYGPHVESTVQDILVDDLGHTDDVVAKIVSIIEDVGIAVADLENAIGNNVRSFFQREFFDLHRAQYSRSRRKAPIYWQLGTATASYSVWLYIHAFSKDTLFRAQDDYVAPKLAHEQRRLESMRGEAGPNPNSEQRKAAAEQEAFVEELQAFLDEVKRVAPLWSPDLDDGVIINSAPLWRLVPQHTPWQKDVSSKWDDLVAGKYDWAHLAMHIWPERVIPKCGKDRSLAIAHGLEDIFWVEGDDGKWKLRPAPTRPVDELVREGTSIAVKSALKSVLEAPAAFANGGRARGRRVANAAADGGAR